MKIIKSSIKVSLRLNSRQFVGLNKWKITVNGEVRLVTSQNVEFYCLRLEDVATSFDPEEVESFNIFGTISEVNQ